jgi:hypothetical protein
MEPVLDRTYQESSAPYDTVPVQAHGWSSFAHTSPRSLNEGVSRRPDATTSANDVRRDDEDDDDDDEDEDEVKGRGGDGKADDDDVRSLLSAVSRRRLSSSAILYTEYRHGPPQVRWACPAAARPCSEGRYTNVYPWSWPNRFFPLGCPHDALFRLQFELPSDLSCMLKPRHAASPPQMA